MIQLGYFSSASSDSSAADIEQILMTSRENNRRYGITGLLLYDKGNYLQIIEGLRAPVLTLFDAIKRDHRHTGVIDILQQPIAERQFPDWAMGFHDLSKVRPDFDGYVEFLIEHFDLGSLKPAGAVQLLGLFGNRNDAVGSTRFGRGPV
jgi:hypothetical protein